MATQEGDGAESREATGAEEVALVAPGVARTVTGRAANLDRLPVPLDVAIPVSDFRVRNLLALEPGRVVETEWVNGDDLPLLAGQVQLAWSELEVIDTRLAVRLTRLA